MLPSVTARSAQVTSMVEWSRRRDRVPRRHITAARRIDKSSILAYVRKET